MYLTNLQSGTKYQLSVFARDTSGNQSKLDWGTFTTLSLPTLSPPDKRPPRISNVSYEILSNNSARITWETDEKATSQVDYMQSLETMSECLSNCERQPKCLVSREYCDKCRTQCDSLSYGLQFPENYYEGDFDNELVTTHRYELHSLIKGRTYKFKVISKDAAKNIATSDDQVFTAR